MPEFLFIGGPANGQSINVLGNTEAHRVVSGLFGRSGQSATVTYTKRRIWFGPRGRERKDWIFALESMPDQEAIDRFLRCH